MSMVAVGGQRAAECTKIGQQASPTAPDPAALGSIAMSIVHDLRNPLAAIHTGAEMLSESQLTDHQIRRVARNIYNASVRIQELLEDYADRCRLDTQLGRWNLRSLVSHAVGKILSVAETQSVVVIQEIPASLIVNVDRRRIASVFANLFTNALEAMPDGGLIHISASAGENNATVRIADAGPGIAPEIVDDLFQPFVTARKPAGWGLGLAQARQNVIDHGGDMWLESSSAKGACLAFSLPLQ